MDVKKSKRSSNFSAKEEHLLIGLIDKHKSAIEDKRSDSASNEVKKKTWEKLTLEYNSAALGDTSRDVMTLRKKYENLKKRAKKKFSDEKSNLKGTGGGPPAHFNFSQNDLTIKDIITTQMTGKSSRFDGDHPKEGAEVLNKEHLVPSLSNENLEDDQENLINEQPRTFIRLFSTDLEKEEADGTSGSKENVVVASTSLPTVDRSKGTPANLRTPVPTPLRNKDRLKSNDYLKTKIGVWVVSKAEWVEQQGREEHLLKLKHMQEKHDLEMEILRIKKRKLCENNLTSS